MDKDTFLRDHFLNDFMVAYGLCISITQQHPSQANNELRNAMVHFSRSLHPEAYIEITNASQGIDTDEEFQSAVKHLRRGKRDCYKMVLFQLGDELASAFTAIEIAHGIVDPALKRRLREIRMKRMKLYAQETVGGAVTDGLQDLVDDMLQLQEDLFSKYTESVNLTV